jgi:hypothetical protein
MGNCQGQANQSHWDASTPRKNCQFIAHGCTCFVFIQTLSLRHAGPFGIVGQWRSMRDSRNCLVTKTREHVGSISQGNSPSLIGQRSGTRRKFGHHALGLESQRSGAMANTEHLDVSCRRAPVGSRLCDQEFKHNLDRYKYPNRYELVGWQCAQRTWRSLHQGSLEERLSLNSANLMGSNWTWVDAAIAPFIQAICQNRSYVV